MPTPAEDPSVRRSRWAVVAAVTVGAALTLGLVPPVVVDGEVPGAEVTLDPPVLRTSDGTAVVRLTLGDEAPGDVTVSWSLRTVERSSDGVVAIGDTDAPGTPPAGVRLRPGETGRFHVTVPAAGEPTLLVAAVRGATGVHAPADGGAPTTLATLLLPGPAPEVLSATVVDEADGVLRGEVRVDRAALVSVRLRGDGTVTYPDRLVTPDAPLVVEGVAATWPLPSLLAVTDETGAVRTADTGTVAVSALAALLVLIAALGVLLSVRHHRRASSPRSQAA